MFARVYSIGRLLSTSLLTGACIATSVTIAFADPATAPVARGGQWVHVDPQTGARTAAPPAAAAVTAGDPAFSTSHQGLVEEPAPGGGTTVNLQGRFRSAAVATVGADGKVSVDCHAPAVPAAVE